MKPSYILERWPHGWLVCGPAGQAVVPLYCISEVMPILSEKGVMDLGIAHHYKASGKHEVVFCIVAPGKDQEAWRAAIVASLATSSRYIQWWRGLDAGRSSAAMFAALSDDRVTALEAQRYSEGALPADSADFGRCVRLLAFFPAWRERLSEVAAAYPDTKWPVLIARWAEIEAADAAQQSEILRSL